MNIPLIGSLLLLSLVVCPILYFKLGPALNALQLETLKTIGVIAGCSAFLCFVLGEITRNNSQVDKIWSILPFVYCWVIAVKGGMHPRLVVMAVLATLWGIRLTFNFARKALTSSNSGKEKKTTAGKCCAQMHHSTINGSGSFSTCFSSPFTKTPSS